MTNTQMVYVTVYNETQGYGGGEEGGWYYTQGQPIDGLYTLCCGATADTLDEDWEPGVSVWGTCLASNPDEHAADCPARGAAERYHREYVLGHTEAYLRSFTHRPDGVSWLDSDEDAPGEYRGEVATNGTNHVIIEADPPAAYPTVRPHYE